MTSLIWSNAVGRDAGIPQARLVGGRADAIDVRLLVELDAHHRAAAEVHVQRQMMPEEKATARRTR